MSRTKLAIAAAILTVTATPALAQPTAPSRTVSYADLDLASAAGRARLEQRIDIAIRAVCGRPSPVDLRGTAEMRGCRAETFAQVMSDRNVGRVFVSPEFAALTRTR